MAELFNKVGYAADPELELCLSDHLLPNLKINEISGAFCKHTRTQVLELGPGLVWSGLVWSGQVIFDILELPAF